MASDPYQTLGVSRAASDAELRRVYRRLVKQHHPDHNAGSLESARRFEAVQEAYAQILEQRKHRGGQSTSGGSGPGARTPPPSSSRTGPDPDLEARLADIERELRKANAAHERARQAAREAAADAAGRHATDEELGYIRTDDTFSKILSDAREEVSGWFGSAREQPATKRVADLLDDLASKLKRDPPKQ